MGRRLASVADVGRVFLAAAMCPTVPEFGATATPPSTARGELIPAEALLVAIARDPSAAAQLVLSTWIALA